MTAALLAASACLRPASSTTALERTEQGFYCVDVALGASVQARFVLDTGAPDSYVSPALAARLRRAGAKPDKEGVFTPREMRLGDVPVEPVRLAPDPPDAENPIPQGCDGLLGNDLWARYRVGLDLAHRALRLWPPHVGLASVATDWFASPLSRVHSTPLGLASDGSFYLPVALSGTSFPLLLDTGTPYSFVAESVAKSLGWTEPVGRTTIGYASGPAPMSLYRADAVEVGGLRLSGMPWIGATRTQGIQGILGADALISVKVLLDFPGRRAYLSPSKADSREPMKHTG